MIQIFYIGVYKNNNFFSLIQHFESAQILCQMSSNVGFLFLYHCQLLSAIILQYNNVSFDESFVCNKMDVLASLHN